MNVNEQLYQLLRFSLGLSDEAPVFGSEEEWQALYAEVKKQTVVGVCYLGASKLPMPRSLIGKWTIQADVIRMQNKLLNSEAKRLTELFANHGRRSVILKGQANARLYPDQLTRQPGDIDIWVEGGKKSVVALTRELFGDFDSSSISEHHVHLSTKENGVVVEVHFKPLHDLTNPIATKQMLKWLNEETHHATLTPECFYAPPIRYALVMQLSHIKMHFFDEGIGLRQITDYYWLLRHSTEEDRKVVGDLLKRFGLYHIAEALMWVLQTVLHLEENLMLCPPDTYRGEWLLSEVEAGGNLGKDYKRWEQNVISRFFVHRSRSIRLLKFDGWGIFWHEIYYWRYFVKSIPVRIRLRKASL